MSGENDADKSARLREMHNAGVRAWRAANPDRVRELNKAWKAANPERSRELNRESERRRRVRQKALADRRAKGRKKYAENKEKERERARRFRAEHPDKAREYQQRYRERHPERALEKSRRNGQVWRDKNAEAVRETNREAKKAQRERDPEAARRWYQANIEKQRERVREDARRRRRLQKLGLPPRKTHRVYASDRRANDKAAEEFFQRRRTAAQKRDLNREIEAFERPSHGQNAVLLARKRIMAPTDLRTAAEALQHRLRAAKIRDMARRFYPEVAEAIRQKHGTRLRQEVEEDSIARQLRGATPYDVDLELGRRIGEQAAREVTTMAGRSSDEERMARLVRASFPKTPNRGPSAAENRIGPASANRPKPGLDSEVAR